MLSVALVLGPATHALAQEPPPYRFDLEAADPTTYDHATGEDLPPPDGPAIHDNSVESLQGEDFRCGDVAVFLLRVKVPSGLPAPETIQVDIRWHAQPTGQPGAGYRDLLEAQPNTGDPEMVTNGDEGVSIVSETVDGFLRATIEISGLDSDEIFMLRLEVKMRCDPGSNPTGNLHARLTGARVVAPEPRDLNTGAQDVPMIGTPLPREGQPPPPTQPPPTGGVETGAGGTAGRPGPLAFLIGLLALGALGVVAVRLVLGRQG